MIEIIWNAYEGKHDSVVRVIQDMIIEIAEFLSKENLDIIYNKIKSIPFDQYTELTLDLIKGFSENAILKYNP